MNSGAWQGFPIARYAWLISVLLGLLGLASCAARAGEPVGERFGGREIFVYVPARLAAPAARALVVVLHGGLGNARRIATRRSESGLNIDDVADRDGFVVAYLDGTPVARFLGPHALGWNAGGCCGLPARAGVDDVGYVTRAVAALTARYGIARQRVFGMGHSNGAMMTLRIMCETRLYAAAVAISGPLTLDVTRCPAARGARILAIHGADDANVPVLGGRGTKGLSRFAYRSEAQSRQVFNDSGAAYTLEIVPGADHVLDHIGAALKRAHGLTIGETAARFFGLARLAL
jgi:polyhydroxybutyrate depolymerase